MSIPRYKINPLFGYLKDAKEGKFCEYRDYLKLEKECTSLKDTVSNSIKAVIAREAENARLKEQVRYFAIEAKDFESKWLMVLEDNARIKGDYNRLLIHCEALEQDIDEGKKS